MTKLGITFHISFLILLLILFVLMFGLPSWKKYQHVGISLEHSVEVSEEGNIFPSLTFCPYKVDPRTAWKNGTATLADPISILPTECNVSSAAETIECISAKTYGRNEVIRTVDIIKQHRAALDHIKQLRERLAKPIRRWCFRSLSHPALPSSCRY